MRKPIEFIGRLKAVIGWNREVSKIIWYKGGKDFCLMDFAHPLSKNASSGPN
jgi:hypothetical protein